MRLTLITLTFICALAFSKANAQIFFLNPSFEDDSSTSPCNDCVPSGWFACSTCGGLNSIWSSLFNLSSASEGDFFTDTNALDSIVYGICPQINLAQHLNCILRAGKTYRFTVDYASLIEHPLTSGFYLGHSHLQIAGCNDSCVFGELLYQHYDVDTNWHQLTVTLNPTVDCNILWFKQAPPVNESYTGLIDNFSSIQCFNYNEVQATTNDTSIALGGCVELNAISTGAYDTAYWKTAEDAVVANGLNGGIVCPTTSTYYVVCSHSTDCGNFWSFDTVHVEVPNSISATQALDISLSPTINIVDKEFTFSCNQNCHLDVYDTNGRLIQSKVFEKGIHSLKLEAGLSQGYYYCKVKTKTEVKTQKIVVIRCD